MSKDPDQPWRERLVAVLAEKDLSKRSVSLAAGLGPGAIHSWLSEGKEPSVENLTAVCRVMGVSLTYMLSGVKMDPRTEEALSLLEGNPDALDGILSLLRSKRAT